ncbi:MAG TPA: ABC transporter permease, partial [Chloroflexota bacterium]|nr:ABC transporter permease [Chloroflexota bacterium]
MRSLPIAGRVGLVFVALWLLLAVIGPSIAPHPVGAVVAQDVYGTFSASHPLGTDYLGRDMLSRILYAARFT